jgi:hypothetical protein
MQNTNAIALTIALVCLAGGIASAQQPLPTIAAFTQTQSSAMVGITAGQTARLSALNPVVPVPLATPATCPAHVAFLDEHGNLLKSADIKVDAGKSVSIDLNRDTDTSTSAARLQIRAVLTFMPPTPVTPASGATYTFVSFIATCRLVPTLEIFDNATSKTQFVLTEFGSPYAATIGVVTPGTTTH